VEKLEERERDWIAARWAFSGIEHVTNTASESFRFPRSGNLETIISSYFFGPKGMRYTSSSSPIFFMWYQTSLG